MKRLFLLFALIAALASPAAAQSVAVKSVILQGANTIVGQGATRSMAPYQIDAAYTQSMSESRHFARGTVQGGTCIVGYANWWAQAGTESTPGASSTLKVGLNYPLGTFNLLKFGGLTTVTMADGATVWSDPFPAPANGAEFGLRPLFTNANGIITSRQQNVDTGFGENIHAYVSGAVDQTLGGTITTNDPGNTGVYAPVGILCTLPAGTPNLALVGDSRVEGFEDTYNDGSHDIGELARALGPHYGYINFGVGGDSTTAVVGGNFAHRQAVLDKAKPSDAFITLGINDVNSGTSAATVLANRVTIAGLLPYAKVRETTFPGRTNSPPGAGNNVSTLGAGEAARETINAAVLAGGRSHIVGHNDVNSALDSGGTPGTWAVFAATTGAPTYTVDGLHESLLGDQTIAAGNLVNLGTQFPPLSKGIPTVSGNTWVGQTLTGTNGLFYNGVSHSYQWYDDGTTPIGGATSSTYVIASGDIGHTVTLNDTGTNPMGSASQMSGPTATITATQPLPLDTMPGVLAAYSSRLLRTAYAGSAMQIKRASDSTTQDIGFVSGEFDQTSANAFCSGTTCTLSIWYDQSGNGSNITCSSNCPTVYAGGALNKMNGKVALLFGGTTSIVLTSSLSTVPIHVRYLNAAVKPTNFTANGYIFGTSASGGLIIRANSSTGTPQMNTESSVVIGAGTNPLSTSTGNIVGATFDGVSAWTMTLDNVANGSGTSAATVSASTTQIGNTAASAHFVGSIGEVIFQDQTGGISSGNRSSYEGNQVTYWGTSIIILPARRRRRKPANDNEEQNDNVEQMAA